jgi:ligand-binding SRPBCC domain-containing protein
MYELTTEITLPRPLAEVFPFFATARNLETLTPDFLRFQVLGLGPVLMEEGVLIDYRLRLRGIPMRWQSEITAWEPPYRFVDEQRRGPYRRWHHEHTFEEVDGQTVARDHVIYDHLGGRLVNRLLVARDIEQIFEYRQKRLRDLFPPTETTARSA